MKILRKIALFLVLVSITSSCDIGDGDSCSSLVGLGVTNVMGPVTANLDQEVLLNVTYQGRGDCDVFNSFFTKREANDRIITVQAMYDPCSCKETVDTLKVEPYKFKESLAGTYILKFKKDNETFVTHTVVVATPDPAE